MRTDAGAVKLVAAAVVGLLSAACRSAPPTTARALDSLFSDLHARGLFDGAVVVTGPRDVYAQGFGYANLERQLPFTPDTPADGASLAKTFTAALLIGLHGEGVLDLDQPAQRLVPDLPYPEVTLRHLISHTSAIPVLDYDFFDPYLPRDQVRTTDVLVRIIGEQAPPLTATPGTTFEYNSLGFDIAALAATRATGKSYVDLLGERFFRPLGISSAFVRPGRLQDFPTVRTRAYQRVGGRLELNDIFDLEGFHGGSNLYLSARDLDKWSLSFMRAPVLRPAELAIALRPATVAGQNSSLTLGSWYRSRDNTAFWYSGHLQGFHSEAFRNLKAGVSVVYVSNNTLEPWLQKGIVRGVSAVVAGGTPPALVAPATEPVAREERGALAGTWLLPSGEDIEIQGAGSTIHVARHGIRYRIVQLAPAAFYVPGLDFILGFAKASDGSFAKIYFSTNVEEAWGSRASTPTRQH